PEVDEGFESNSRRHQVDQRGGDLRTIATLQYVGALIITLPLSLVFEHQHFDGAAQAYGALAWSVFGLSMGGVGLLLYLIRRG
ncbi:hypothetical protein AB9F45_37610, partial [Rhizobium leguminosarum]